MRGIVEDFFKGVEPNEVVVYAHADHDGICAAFGLIHLFGDLDVRFSQSFRPRELPFFSNKKVFVICDLQLSKNQIMYLLNRGLRVLNLDHHEVVDVEHGNYFCANPKKIFKNEFISSSGLIWRFFEPEKISWILAVGSAGDLAVEGVMDLFERVYESGKGLIDGLELKQIYLSKIFEIAQILLMSFNEPASGLNLVKKAFAEGYNVFYDSVFYSSYLKKREEIEVFFEREKDKVFEGKRFVLIDSSGQDYAGSYSVFLNLKNLDQRIYAEYCNGRIYFRNFFGKDSILDVARLFGGGGAHKRSGGAYTRKSFAEVLRKIQDFFDSRQKSLFDF